MKTTKTSKTQTLNEGNTVLAPPLVKDQLLSNILYNTITASLLPVAVGYIRERDEYKYVSGAWWYFREMLLNLPVFENKWTDKDFRKGISILNDLAQATEDRPTKIEQFSKFETAHRLFGSRDKIDGVKSLISCLQVIRGNHKRKKEVNKYLEMEDLDSMLISLSVIEKCQELWTVSKEKNPE